MRDDEAIVLLVIFTAAAFGLAVPIALPCAIIFATLTQWQYDEMPAVLFGFGTFYLLYITTAMFVLSKVK